MPVALPFRFLVFVAIGRTILSKSPEEIRVQRDESFTFDCALDESVFYAQRLGDWSEVSEENDNSQFLNLKIQPLTAEKVVRVTCPSAQPENVGYYGCRKSSRSSSSMSRVFQLVLADVESFYWTYVCHGAAGSCDRQDDSNDETRSVFSVADQTTADLFCCASTSGFAQVEVKMNAVGDGRSRVNEQRRLDLDGSSVVCAKQHPFFTRSASNAPTFTCELILDQRSYKTYTSRIVLRDPMLVDPDDDYPSDVSTRSLQPNDGGFFEPTRRPLNSGGVKGKLSTGKKLAIILGSTFGGVVLLAVILSLCICLRHKNKVSKKKSDPTPSANEQKQLPSTNADEDSAYVEATPLYVNAPVFLRL